MKGLLHHAPTDDDISNILKEFTVDFLLKGYGYLVQELHAKLLSELDLVRWLKFYSQTFDNSSIDRVAGTNRHIALLLAGHLFPEVCRSTRIRLGSHQMRSLVQHHQLLDVRGCQLMRTIGIDVETAGHRHKAKSLSHASACNGNSRIPPCTGSLQENITFEPSNSSKFIYFMDYTWFW